MDATLREERGQRLAAWEATCASVAERSMTFRTRGPPCSRLPAILWTIAHNASAGTTSANAVRLFLRDTFATPADGLVTPVTVADAAGRFAPAVLMVRMPQPAHGQTNRAAWDAIKAAVAQALAPVHGLGEDEELVRMPRYRRQPKPDMLVAPILPTFHSSIPPVTAYAGADAARHARAGNTAGPALFTAGDPNTSSHEFARDRVNALVFTVMPRANPEARALFAHVMRQHRPHGVFDGGSKNVPCALTCHVPEATEEALARALRPYAGIQRDMYQVSVARRHRTHTLHEVTWGELDDSNTPDFLDALAARTVVANPELEAAQREQAGFFELLHAAVTCISHGASDRPWFDVETDAPPPQPAPAAPAAPAASPAVVSLAPTMSPQQATIVRRNVRLSPPPPPPQPAAAAAAAALVAAPVSTLVRLNVRLFSPRTAAGLPRPGRIALRGITALDPAWADIDDAYLPIVMRHANHVVASEDVVLRVAEEASAALAPAPDPPGLAVTLHPTQAKTLAFMLAAEDAHAPLALDMASALPGAARAGAGVEEEEPRGAGVEEEGEPDPGGRGAGVEEEGEPDPGGRGAGVEEPDVRWSPFTREQGAGYGAVFDAKRAEPGGWCPRPRRGGIVANQAGTGKTILTLALILARPAPDAVGPEPRATLVLCPASIVTQWVAETERAAPSLRVIAARAGHAFDMRAAATTHDVVVCGFPAMFNARAENICAASWRRLVVDEAHLARHHANALERVRAPRAWCLTGTPFGVGGSTRDLESLARIATGFSGPPPLLPTPWQSPLTLTPASFRNLRMINLASAEDVAPFFALARKLMVRFSLHDAESGRGREGTSDVLVAVPLPTDAQEAYARLEEESRADVTNLTNRTRELMTRPLLRLRDWCAGAPTIHGRLLATRRVAAAAAATAIADDGVTYDVAEHGVAYNDPEADTCAVCMEPLVFARLAMPPCRHWFCVPCIRTAVLRWQRCPTCRKPATLATLRVQPEAAADGGAANEADEADEAVEENRENEENQENGNPPENQRRGLGNQGAPPSVFAAKVAALAALAADMDGEKFIVFTRITAMARPYAEALAAAGIPATHYTRRLPERERNANKARFVSEPSASLRAIVLDIDNAEGIDGLQVARRVVFCEPFPATDGNQRSQAVSRCERLGQERPVIVRTLAFAGTTEERIAAYTPPRSTPPIRRVRHYVGA